MKVIKILKKKKGVKIQMKNEKGITLAKLIIIIGIVIVGIILISNNSKSSTKIEWGYMPSPEYYELRVAVLDSQLYGSGTLSESSFNTLGKDVKKANGKWFKNSNVNFKASILDNGNTEITTLSDGEHTATFTFDNSSNYVYYTFKSEDHTGYRIIIK